jgi:RNA polymerase sigma factor (sigma-70 family)
VHDEEYDGTRAALWEAVQALAPRQRAVIVLRYYEQLSEAETAEVLGVSVGTVKSQASRAIAALRERLGDRTDLVGWEEER